MHGHVRRRHKPECAHRKSAAKRCNCDGSWQARMPDPVRGATAKIERTFRMKHETVQRYINRLGADPKLAAGTVRNVYSVLRNAMNKGVRLGMVKANPC